MQIDEQLSEITLDILEDQIDATCTGSVRCIYLAQWIKQGIIVIFKLDHRVGFGWLRFFATLGMINIIPSNGGFI